MIATASADCTVKIWDPRSSNSNPILTFQQHQKEVSDIAISPDGRWMASAGKEGLVKIWEIDTGKIIKEIKSSQQPINCLDYNPSTLTLAYGSYDKSVCYWDLENFQSICQTAPDTSDIIHLSFYEENPDLLFAASHDHIRLWNVETNKQLDCLSLPPKTITDMKISLETGDSGLLLVSAIQQNTVSIYYAHLKNINFDESIDMLPTSNKEKEGSSDVNMTNQQAEDMNMISRVTYVRAPKDEPVNLDMSDFEKHAPMEPTNQDSGKKDIEIINECMDRHTTFNGVMQRRIANIKVVMNYILRENDIGHALNALSMIKDPTVSMDILNSTFAKNKRMEMLNFEKVAMLIPHVQDLIDSKYETHMKAGLLSAQNVLNAF